MLFSIPDIRHIEQYTMLHEPITPLDLMERAGCNFSNQLRTDIKPSFLDQFVIFCGQGNNGGDGLVIARYLSIDTSVIVVKCCFDEKVSEQFQVNLEQLEKMGCCKIIGFDDLPEIQLTPTTYFIDALFGIGLSKPMAGKYLEGVDFINNANVPVIAVDVPSGLYCDQHTPLTNKTVHATKTYTFQFMKQAYLMPENESRVGEVQIIDIGLLIPDDYQPKYRMIDLDLMKALLKKRAKFSHKGTHGHGLLMAGSAAMPGAAVLAAMAALRGGIGKLTVHAPHSVLFTLSHFLPEALMSFDQNDNVLTHLPQQLLEEINAIGMGPGLGKKQQTVSVLKDILHEQTVPLVLDADALNMLSENKTWLAFLPSNTILTPHYKEFERLAGHAENGFARIELLKKFAQKYEVVVILKGAYSSVALPSGEVWFNTTGNSGLATAGSGDILTGLVLALLAQGYSTTAAALLAVYIHGRAADIAVQEFASAESLIASDIPLYFGRVFKQINEQ